MDPRKPRNPKPSPKEKKEKERKVQMTPWLKEKEKRKIKMDQMAKRHKQKLLDAKINRQRQRNQQMRRMRPKLEQQIQGKRRNKEKDELALTEEEIRIAEQQFMEESAWRRFCLYLEDKAASILYFLTVTLRSERTFDWFIFLANNLGLFQEYEINDYGQRLSPRTGRPVLLSLGPFRVVQVVESSNQVRSHWDPYIRDYLKNSKLTTDCWRANRMALTVALCMDDTGQMFDMPIYNSALNLS